MGNNWYRNAVRERLSEVAFPCHLFVVGPERTYRTTYRAEHPGCLGDRWCEDLDAAVQFVEQMNYEGFLSEMSFFRSATEIESV